MAHELTINASTGRAEMAYVGAKAWHGLGQELTAGATIEEWKVAAGMDWQVNRAMVRYFADAEAACMMNAPEREVLFRSDNFKPLGFVSPDYEIVQPAQVLEFFRDLVADQGMQLESAGTLFGGRRFWALAKMDSQDVVAGDAVGGYLLMSTSADGSMATEARQTSVRVVCNNTLRIARNEIGGAVAPVKISHRSTYCDKRIKSQLGLSRDNFERGMQSLRDLAAVTVTTAGAEDFVRRLLRPEEHAAKVMQETNARAAVLAAEGAGADDLRTLLARSFVPVDIEPTKRAPRGEGQILDLFGRSAIGGTMAGAQGTAWGLVNAVTEYVDHHASAKSGDHRAASAWFGSGDDLKVRALELAQTLR